MKYIGIDPALRKNGLAVCVIDSLLKKCITFRFRKYNDFHRWALGLPVQIVGGLPASAFPTGEFYVCIEDSNEDNSTFKGKKSTRNAYGAISRDAGKNMAVSALIIDAMTATYPKKLRIIAPSEKPQINRMSVVNTLKSNGYDISGIDTEQEDEMWAVMFAFLLMR